jgi:hypothetical protein
MKKETLEKTGKSPAEGQRPATEEVQVCQKAFSPETARAEDEDDPCRTAEN